MAFCWLAMMAHIVSSGCGQFYSFVIFQGGGGVVLDHLPSSLLIYACVCNRRHPPKVYLVCTVLAAFYLFKKMRANVAEECKNIL